MATAYTSLLGFALPVTGELLGTWGDTVNTSITSLVEDSIAGSATASVTSADWTLTTTGSGVANQARCAILIPTGTPGVSRNIIVPSQSKAYIVNNQSNAAVVVKGSATTGVSINAGKSALVAWNGSDFVLISNDLSAPSPIGNVTPNTGAFTTLTSTSTTTLNGTTIPASATLTKTTDKLNVFAATTSAELAGIITNETGSGALVFGTSPTIGTPAITGGTINNTVIGGTTRAAGSFTTLDANGNVVLGDATADTVSVNGRVNTDVVPSTDNARDLGATALKWKQVFATTFTESGSPVVVQTDIGTAPNEIPLNQYLGSMAYLDADNVSFSATGTNAAAQNLAINKLTTVTISADTTLTTTVPKVGSSAYVIVITSGATSRTVTFGTGFKSTGTLATGTDADRRFVFHFISDGANLVEVSRTAAITY